MTHSVEITVENILEDRLNPNTSATIADSSSGTGTQAAARAAAHLLHDDESDVNDDDDSEEDLESTEDETGLGSLAAAGSINGERNLRRRNILS